MILLVVAYVVVFILIPLIRSLASLRSQVSSKKYHLSKEKYLKHYGKTEEHRNLIFTYFRKRRQIMTCMAVTALLMLIVTLVRIELFRKYDVFLIGIFSAYIIYLGFRLSRYGKLSLYLQILDMRG